MNELLRRLLNLPEQASTVAADVDRLHYFVILVTMAGSCGVFGVAFAFLLRYRQRGESPALTPSIHVNPKMEAGLICSMLVLFVSIWIVGFRQYLRIIVPPDDAMSVYVTGKQWMWKFSYVAGPSSAGVLYVPVHRPVKLLITSRDVIHSFFVPAFRIKMDAVPGRYTTTWFEANQTGTFPIECSQYCGTRHSMMLADVVVLSEADFERWQSAPDGPIAEATPSALLPESAAEPTWSPDLRQGLVAHGEKAAADFGCLRCHTTDGSPHIGPTWTGLFGKREELRGGGKILVDEAYLTESMMDPAVKIVAGFQPVMPSYQGRIDPGEVAAIVEYIKTLKPGGPRKIRRPSAG